MPDRNRLSKFLQARTKERPGFVSPIHLPAFSRNRNATRFSDASKNMTRQQLEHVIRAAAATANVRARSSSMVPLASCLYFTRHLATAPMVSTNNRCPTGRLARSPDKTEQSQYGRRRRLVSR